MRKAELSTAKAGRYALVIAVAFFMVGPVLVMLSSSFKPDTETYDPPPTLLPDDPTWSNYIALGNRTEMSLYMRNSAMSAGFATAITLPLAAGIAYATVRCRGHAPKLIPFAEHAGLAAYMVAPILLATPLARILHRFGLIDTLTGLTLVYVAQFLPFALWVLRPYVLGAPVVLEEAALVDGATRFQAIYKVVLPQMVPGLIVTGVFVFNAAWSEYLFASVLLRSGDKLTITAGVSNLMSQGAVPSWGLLMAAGVVLAAPVVVASMALQRHLTTGAGTGAVKG